MRSKRKLKSLKLEKKTISSLNGGVELKNNPQGRFTNLLVCGNTISFRIDCFPLDTINCPKL
jgi:hypothetical protein